MALLAFTSKTPSPSVAANAECKYMALEVAGVIVHSLAVSPAELRADVGARHFSPVGFQEFGYFVSTPI